MSTKEQYIDDLESCGIATSNNLRELLQTCQDPVEAIKEFQAKNSIQLSSLKPIMKLLDLHGVRRAEFYETVNNDITDRLMTKIKSLGESRTPEDITKLEQQLERCFRLYRVPKLRPIVLLALQMLPKIPDRYLKLIVCDKEFYNECAVTVRQQIWVKNDTLFMEAINPVIDDYLEEKQKILLSVEKKPPSFFTCDTTKSRRQWKQIQQLISMVGERESLYTRITEVIRERYVKTGDALYCSLRLELLMAVHDFNVDYAVKFDACHDFAWCLDACLMQKHLDSQQTSKLKALLLDTSKKSKVMSDLGIIASDPHVVHFLCSMVIKVLKDIASSGNYLPRDHVPLYLLMKILYLGASRESAKYEDPSDSDYVPQFSVNQECITKFLPALVSMITEDIIRLELQKSSDEIAEEFGQEKELKEISENTKAFLRNDRICALLWIHYLLDILPSKKKAHDHTTILRYIEMLSDLADNMGTQDIWLHLLVHRILHTTQIESVISNEEIAAKFIKSLLMNSIQRFPNIKFHILRLCAHLKPNLPVPIYEPVRKKLADIYADIVTAPSGCFMDKLFMKEYEANRDKLDSARIEVVLTEAGDTLLPPSPQNPLKVADELVG
ncbi:cofactor of BRCA1 (COBRA1) domain-containing protein [Ditylenchus destructor]|uniref:Cofactor of BRCA1 (COBRA1) domain-containing protein n=1 Tax=Ditylenchus destructor TaxID=166010 RepID=A0AAD4R3V5_9BILA|nr:cofactor of BRCA1 (COBRA1) domain-containing protein [Ditylenchus destructor]